MADDPAGGFLGRWSRRKQGAREGRPLAEPAAPPADRSPAALPTAGAGDPAARPLPVADEPVAVPQPPLPTLDDVRTLTPESDFKPFVAQGVAPEVKNAAMKKLFADPHLNVMDRLDIYIDDYSRPDPLPEAMLRQMASAKFLKLFDDEEKKDVPPRDDADNPTGQSVAQSLQTQEQESVPPDPVHPANASPPAPDTGDSPQDHAHHPDLRLQPDDAAPAQEPGHGAS